MLKMKKKIAVTLVLIMTLAFVNGCADIGVYRETDAEETIRIDLSVHAGLPLFKRQNVFSPSHSFVGDMAAEFARDAHLLKEMYTESQRVDLFMGNGGIGGSIGLGTKEKIQYNYMALDAALKQFYKNGVLPYVTFFATPNALYDKSAAASNYWKYPPVDMELWGEVCKKITAHYRDLGWPLAAYEIWNEPDWFDRSVNAKAFYCGTWKEYLEIYRYAVNGIRDANPYASVGGLSLATFSDAYMKGEVDEFLTYVKDNGLPLDFISYHCYVTSNYQNYTSLANRALEKYGDTYVSVGLHLNEFHVSGATSTTSTEKCVSDMMDALMYFAETPQITSVNWACFRESSEGIGMINSRNGKRYAAYHLLSFYNRMPVDRVKMEGTHYIRGFASADEERAGVLLYNRTWKDRESNITVAGIPYETYDITVYGIDENNSNYGRNGGSDEASVIWEQKGMSGSEQSIKLALSSGSVAFIEIISGDADEHASPTVYDGTGNVLQGDVATVLKREYYFENRESTMFSEFDLASFSAWVGMGDRDTGTSRGSVYLENIPESLRAHPEMYEGDAVTGELRICIEYLDECGELYAGHVYSSADGTLVPGTDINVICEDWRGGVVKITYEMKDCGSDHTMKIGFTK